MGRKKVLLGVVEDFVPINSSDALVTTGTRYAELTAICKVQYSLANGKVILNCAKPEFLVTGVHLRLGGLFNSALVYSDTPFGVLEKIGKEVRKIGEGIQPWINQGSVYSNRKLGNIPTVWKDGKVFIEPWNGYCSMGKPMINGDWLYFEARCTTAPMGWEVWRKSLVTGEQECLLSHAANPCVFDGKLFYGSFLKEIRKFALQYLVIPDGQE